ncbi:hypothetical protein J2S98_004606 [Arthrobacter oryzae]|uniref:hypothetical protein n=1 Tax=Micrococcaceae TaxID=1268 RepID=UPI00277E9562|nr:hypothetical protein [Arthrobacter oryzae]MDP9989416.1 hypothetical protein [Arthrobacter oryzae]
MRMKIGGIMNLVRKALLILATMLALFSVAAPSYASTTLPSPSPSLNKEEPDNDQASPSGLWWPEVDVYVGCSGSSFAYSGAAWDLQGGAYYETWWSVTFPDGTGEYDNWPRQTLQASSSGFLTTSTFYAANHGSGRYTATMYLKKDGSEVGRHTTECYK